MLLAQVQTGADVTGVICGSVSVGADQINLRPRLIFVKNSSAHRHIIRMEMPELALRMGAIAAQLTIASFPISTARESSTRITGSLSCIIRWDRFTIWSNAKKQHDALCNGCRP